MKTQSEILADVPDATVIRQFSIRTEDFEHFRACRTAYEKQLGTIVTNSQALSLILTEHRERFPFDASGAGQ